MNRAKPKKSRKEFKRLWREAVEEVHGPLLPEGAGRASEFGVVKHVAVVRDDSGQRFRVFTTGDPKHYLFCPLYGETSITWGDPFPVLKSSLPREWRRALANGWGNDTPREQAVFSFGEEGRPFGMREALDAIEEARGLNPRPAYLIFVAEEFEPEVVALVEKVESTEGITLLAARRTQDGFYFVR